MIPLEENALMNAVCAFVDEMRRFNWPIERMIIEVKRVAEVEDGQLFRALIGEHQSRVEAQRLISRLVSQCITHYYATSST